MHTTTNRHLRREALPATSKLRARYGVYLDGKRIGAVGLTRERNGRGGHWWPIYGGQLYSKVPFASRNAQARLVVQWYQQDNPEHTTNDQGGTA